MRVVVVTPPAPLIDVPTVRARLGGAPSADDATLAAYVQAATDELDGPGGWLGRALGPQTLELQSHHFPNAAWPCAAPGFDEGWLPLAFRPGRDWGTIHLPYPEVQGVVSVSYLDGTGTRITLAPGAYVLSGRELSPAFGTLWPVAQPLPGSVAIRYTAGYATVPEALRQALVLMVAQMVALGRPDPFLKQDTAIGVASQSWDTSPTAGALYETAAGRLLGPLRVFL